MMSNIVTKDFHTHKAKYPQTERSSQKKCDIKRTDWKVKGCNDRSIVLKSTMTRGYYNLPSFDTFKDKINLLDILEVVNRKSNEQEKIEIFFENKLNRISAETICLQTNIGGDFYEFPIELSEIFGVLRGSEEILKLEDNWDGEGAVVIQEGTWKNAIQLVINYAKFIEKKYHVVIKAPEINPCRNGSIDIVWRTQHARFLVNVKPVGNPVLATYYGDLYADKQAIKNFITDQSIVEYLAFWMKNLA